MLRAAAPLWIAAFLAGLALSGAVAPAAAWNVVPAESEVLFSYQRNGKPAEGSFGRFSGDGSFDPAAPEKATLVMRIESASIDLNDRIASAFATSAEWFDSANHPEVVYRLLQLTPQGGNLYRAEGELTIRGKTRGISTTITLEIENGSAHASGSLDLDRTDYLLGVGPIALFVDVGRDVSVRFDLMAHPAP